MVVHPKCALSVTARCGMPTEYYRHFALMMSMLYREEAGQLSDIDQSAVKMEGWLKVPRSVAAYPLLCVCFFVDDV